jgi:hypothetical protein
MRRNQLNKRRSIFMGFKMSVMIFCAVFVGVAHAAVADDSNSVDLLQTVQQSDEATLQSAAIIQSESFRALPTQLKNQGVEVSADQESQFNQIADSLTLDANTPGLKDRMVTELGKRNHVISRAAIDTLHGLGYAGSVAVSLFLIPFEVPADFLSALITGKPAFADDTPFAGEAAGYVGAGLGYYYSWISISVVAGAGVIAPVIFGPLGIESIDQIVCQEKNPSDSMTLVGGAATASAEAGDFLHNLIAVPIKKFLGLFPHKPKKPKPIVSCTGVCTILNTDGVTWLKDVDVTGSSEYNLEIACSDAAGIYAHPWKVKSYSCTSSLAGN